MTAASFEGKAWKMTDAGAPSDPALAKLTVRTLPSIQKDQVLVKVAAAALNPIDYKIAKGHMAMVAKPPCFLGKDFAGVVFQAGEASGFERGQEVFGDVGNAGEADPCGGSLSEYMIVPGCQIALKPKSLEPAEAASLSLGGQTVLDCMAKAEAQQPLPAGARVLILGASGGVGSVAIQICRARGLHTIGVCSGKNRALVESLGADEVIDYREHDWSKRLKDDKVDVVFDFAPSNPMSSSSWEKAVQVLKAGQPFITISGPDEEGQVTLASYLELMARVAWRNTFSGFKYRFVVKATRATHLMQLSRLVSEGNLKPVVEKVYPFSEVLAAYGHLMSGRAVGKICVTVP